jgi:phosphoribosylformimino-5-aminoimidazole carboxamide ribotide isomerase
VSSASEASAFLEAGAARVVLGSAILAFRDVTENLLEGLGESLVLGIEADGPTIRPRGRGHDLVLRDTLVWLGGLRVPRYLFTGLGRVGALAGPDLDGTRALATQTGRPVLVSGGVRGPDDLRRIADLGEPVEGAIVGRALYEGLDPREALAMSRR